MRDAKVGEPRAWPVRKLILSEKSVKSTDRTSAASVGLKVELTRSAKPSVRCVTSESLKHCVALGSASLKDVQRCVIGVEMTVVKKAAARKVIACMIMLR